MAAIAKVLLPGVATATGELVKYGIDGGFNTGQFISDVGFGLAWGNFPGKYLFKPVSNALKESCKYHPFYVLICMTCWYYS